MILSVCDDTYRGLWEFEINLHKTPRGLCPHSPLLTNQMELKQVRNSHLELNEVYFWTSTIKNWLHLLDADHYKQVIVDSLIYLVKAQKVTVYAFVIMPNHIHLIWELNDLNGKEMPHASFNKFTSHQFLQLSTLDNSKITYKVNDKDRSHRFWQRDPLAVQVNSKRIIEQKLDYIHLNPLQEKWNLVKHPEDYKWSSAGFYETGIDNFGFLTHYRERF